ncbi:RagB/SusD family nutrient uptake outer membrane protein [Dyadobacter aurulentus]|uniref:RagB/SusD family nutrient uptake outer membrane protein n=1 Tax=Dyadobacter sp. UC 10 TaxID=2605428 RepID=UPI0011F351BB|nr:RagB/SusD family nutrient uptake outer membrane protein [Dyadobacter sp. UC 10]KAA0988695.1 RagB/SusD family nutrient uptake outer membrane protein [Dyadobacter sp. UC 10]
MKAAINYFKIIGMGILMLVLPVSCDTDEFLENANKANLTDQTQWESETNADVFLNDVYSEIPNKLNQTETLDYFSDDYNISHYYTASNWRQGVTQIPSSSTDNPWGGTQGPTYGYTWQNFFVKIRKCNTFMQKLTENKANFSEAYFNKRIDEARFLRAFFYSEFFVQIGGLPIIKEPLDRNTMSPEELLRPRNTFQETFDFIVTELDQISKNEYLAVKYNLSDKEAGRATLGAALAVKGWIELFGASPLFNTSTPYLTDAEKFVHFGNYDPARWAKAAATNKEFIEKYGNGKNYNLFADLKNLFRASNEYNSEVIWDRQVVANVGGMGSSYEQRGGPTYVLGEYRSWGNYNPTQELVDQFAMANGKPITDPTSGYNPQKPYVNREKRFYDAIVHDGAIYKQEWMPRADTIYTRIDATYPNPDRTNQIDLAGKTDVGDSGYYQKKRLNPDAAPGSDASGQNYIFFRYGEILLNFAEAQNEASGPDASVYDAINKLRARSELPALPGGLSKEAMRAAIARERRVELCFEDKRFLDNKRLAMAATVMNKPRHNMVIRNSVPANNSGVWVYTVEEEKKYKVKFELKQYMSPIPQNVLDQNPGIRQNPGY